MGIIGLGYVGLPLAIAIGEAGFKVVGLEKDGIKRGRLTRGEDVYEGASVEIARRLIADNILEVTGDCYKLADCDVICICVPTPLSKNRDPDLSLVGTATLQVKDALCVGSKPKLVIVESTSYPGTTREVVAPVMEECGMELGRDFFLAYSQIGRAHV